MSNKLVSRLLSFTLSATVALTSGVPALAYDGGGGDWLGDDEEIQLLEEEEVGSDFDAEEEDIVEDDYDVEEGDVVEEEETSFSEETEDAEFTAVQRTIILAEANGGSSALSTAYGVAVSKSKVGATYKNTGTATNLKWTLQKAKTAGGNEYEDGELPSGLIGTVSEDTMSYSITGRGLEYMATHNYRLVVEDLGDNTTDSTKADAANIPFTITVDNASTHAVTGANGEQVIYSDAAYNFGSKQMGYKVLNADDAGIAEPKVVAKTVKLTSTLEDVAKITDLKATIKNVQKGGVSWNGKPFELVGLQEGVAKELYLDHPVEFKVKPVVGLTSEAVGGTTYTATLELSSKAFSTPISYSLEFTVGTDMTWTIKQGDGDAVPIGSSPTLKPIKIGERMDPIVITAVGGVKEAQVETAGLSGLFTTERGIIATPDASAGTLTLSGTPQAALITDGSPSITLQNIMDTIDDTGDGTINIGVKDYYGNTGSAPLPTLTINAANVTYDGEYGLENQNWYAAEGYTADAAKKDVVIANNSSIPLRITATLSDEDTDGDVDPEDAFVLKYGSTTDTETLTNIEIPANDAITLSLLPTTGNIAGARNNAVLTITGNGIASAMTTVTMNISPVGLSITYPETAEDDIANLNDAQVGLPYTSETILTTASTNVKISEWSIVQNYDVDGDTTNTTSDQFSGGVSKSILESTYGLQLVPSADKKSAVITGTAKGSGTIKVGIQVDYLDAGDNPSKAYACYKIDLVQATIGALEFSADGTAIETTEYKPYAIPTITIDDSEGSKATFSVKNITAEHMSNLKARVVKLNGDASALFTVKTSGDAGATADIGTLKSKATVDFELESIAPKDTDSAAASTPQPSALVAGDYIQKVEVVDDSTHNVIGTVFFKLSVKAAPVLTVVNDTAAAGGSNSTFKFTVGKDVGNTNLFKPTVATTYDDAAYSWSKDPDDTTVFDIQDSGLSLVKDASTGYGVITGVPTKAGTYNVIVEARSNGLSGTKKAQIIVDGDATLTTQFGASHTVLSDATYLFPGVIAGTAAYDESLIVNVQTTKEARDVKISTSTNSSTGVKMNSASFFDVTPINIASISTGNMSSFTIKPKADALLEAGCYKMDVAVYAENAAPDTFTVEFNVVPELSITKKATPATASVGADYKMALEASTKDQTVTWTNPADLATSKGITLETLNNLPAGFSLTAAGGDNSYKATIGDGYDTAIKPTTAGDYSFVIKATAAEVKGTVALGAYVNKSADLVKYPKQEKEFTIALPISKSNKMNVVSVNSGHDVIIAGTTKAVAEALPEVKDGRLALTYGDDGKVNGITSYKFKNQTVGSIGDDFFKVSVRNTSGVALNINAPKTNTDSYKLTNGNGTTAFGPTVTVNAGDTLTIWATPKNTLAKGTYNDSLVISGDNIETVSIPISFEAEEVRYGIGVEYFDYQTNATKMVPANNETDIYTVVVENSAAVSGKEIILNPVKKGEASYPTAIRVLNTGNVNTSIGVVEAKDATGAIFGAGETGQKLTITSGADASLVPFDENDPVYKTVSIAPKSTTLAGVTTAYINVNYYTADSSIAKKITVPVKVVIADNVAPVTTGNITIAESAEGYAPTALAQSFVVSNPAGSGKEDNYLGTVEVTVDGEEFEIVTDEIVLNNAPTTVKVLPTGKDATFTVKPVAGLAYGEYTRTITVTATNMAAPITKAVTFKVTASDTLTTETIISDPTDTNGITVSGTIAERLYNSVVATGTSRVEIVSGDTTSLTTKIDINGDEIKNLKIEFTGTGGTGSALATVTSAEIIYDGTTALDKDVYTVNFIAPDSSKKLAAQSKYFSSVVFNVASVVPFRAFGDDEANPDYVFDSVDNIKTYVGLDDVTVFAKDGVTPYTNANVAALDDVKKASWMLLVVPNGKTIGSVISALPNVKRLDNTKHVLGWKLADGTPITTSTVVKKALSPVMDVHEHEYNRVDNSADAKGKTWDILWTANSAGGYDADLVFYCIDKNCTAEDKGVISQDKKILTPANASTDNATWTKGSRVTYTASFTVGSVIFKATKDEAEQDDAKGVVWKDPVITWGEYKPETGLPEVTVKVSPDYTDADYDADADGEVEAQTLESTVEEVKVAATKEATCTTAGLKAFQLTYTPISGKKDASGAYEKLDPIKNDENMKQYRIPATGHSEEFEQIIEEFDEELLKATVTLKCKNENCDVADHIVFGPETVSFAKQADGTYTATVTLTDGTQYKIVYVADIPYAPEVKWTTEWPATWKKSEAYPTMKYTVTYKWAKAGTSDTTEEFTATVTSDPATVNADTKKVSFTATADLSAFFADAAGTTVAQNATKTSAPYMFLNDKSDESEEVIEISDDESAMVIIGLRDEYDYTGAPIKPGFDVLDTADETRYLIKGTDYSVKFKDNKKAGTATIEIKGKGNYEGKALAATFKIVDRRAELTAEEAELLGEVKSVKLAVKKYTYTGAPIYPETITVKFTDGERTFTNAATDGGYSYVDTTGDIPAVVTFSNNIDKGTAKVTVAGKTKTKSTTFTIKAAKLEAGKDGKGLEAEAEPAEIAWAVKGATPAINATWNGIDLVEGRDFKVTYVYSDKKTKFGAATATITGKGNFSGKVASAASFTIGALDDFRIAEVKAKAGTKADKVKLVVVDPFGQTVSNKLYDVAVLDASGEAVSGALAANTEYTFTATRKSGVTQLGEAAVTFTTTFAADLAKAKVKVLKKPAKTYTGEALTFEDEEFDAAVAITVDGKTLKCGDDFIITNYQNNIKKGTMKVTITGIGEYSGTKVVKVKIGAKKLTK